MVSSILTRGKRRLATASWNSRPQLIKELGTGRNQWGRNDGGILGPYRDGSTRGMAGCVSEKPGAVNK